jgi:hypothetical protein
VHEIPLFVNDTFCSGSEDLRLPVMQHPTSSGLNIRPFSPGQDSSNIGSFPSLFRVFDNCVDGVFFEIVARITRREPKYWFVSE